MSKIEQINKKAHLPFMFASAIAFVAAFFTLSWFIKAIVLLGKAPSDMVSSITVTLFVTAALTISLSLIGFHIQKIWKIITDGQQ